MHLGGDATASKAKCPVQTERGGNETFRHIFEAVPRTRDDVCHSVKFAGTTRSLHSF